MTRVLHIMPHMGGGVGRALSGFAVQARRSELYEHAFVCLEKPEKRQFIDIIQDAGCTVTIAPTRKALIQAVEAADIVQVEFWNHPSLMQMLCTIPLPAMRLIVWCHVSGLHFPVIPREIVDAAQKFVFTSPHSYASEEIRDLPATASAKLATVSSGGGFDELPLPDKRPSSQPRAGYVGSLNFSKLHPDYVAMLAAVRDPEFSVRVIGDETNRAQLEQQCRDHGRPGLLDFHGYRTDIIRELADLDLFVYLLNPAHYGTTEIALLEAMAMGVVPIVLDNACERQIVTHGVTGMVVRDGAGLADAVEWLMNHGEERIAMGRRAAAFIREKYTYGRIEASFNRLYRELMGSEKRKRDFNAVFGHAPADWFRKFLREPADFGDHGTVRLSSEHLRHAMFERSKGSAFHYVAKFPQDRLLTAWASALAGLQ